MAKVVHVAAGIIRREHQIYLTKRLAGSHQAGKWEFPGGKVEKGETAADALCRELKEEIGIDVAWESIQGECFETVVHHYPDKTVRLEFIEVLKFTGEPSGLEGQEGRWFDLSELSSLEFPKANEGVVTKLLDALF